MSKDTCLGCGVLLPPNVYDCPVCGFDNSFNHYPDGSLDEDFMSDFRPEEDPGY